MKIYLPCPKSFRAVILFIAIFSFGTNAFSQDSVLAENFSKGVDPSAITATTGFQSVTLSWNAVCFPSSAKRAGYLIFYSTSTPVLLASPNGNKPNNAVYNGIMVPAADSTLPGQPATRVTANGLTNGTTYNFMIAAYTWDGASISSYTYSPAAAICVTVPPNSPGNLTITVDSLSGNTIKGIFNPPIFKPDGYVVAYSKSPSAPTLTNGVMYASGEIFMEDTILQVSDITSFTADVLKNKLSNADKYYIHVHSYVLSKCTNMPVYSTDFLSANVPVPASHQQDTVNNIEIIDVEPNPTASDAWLRVSSAKSNQIAFSVIAADGRVVTKQTATIQPGINRVDLHCEALRSGMYVLLAVFNNGTTKIIQFIKK
ncbi:MAG TPA: T9SS type A sorting domain-containing protein [Puia sp.]|nr:T9SS type A sorting domain-containing protein [Puia sp.]